MTKAALYYHFESKDELLIALVSPLLDRVDQLLEDMEKRPNGEHDKRLLLERYADILAQDRRAAAILGRDLNVSSHPAIAPRIENHVRRLMDLLTGSVPDPEELVRVSSAMTIIQRGLVGRASEQKTVGALSRDEHRRILVRLAFGILEQRFADGTAPADPPSPVPRLVSRPGRVS
ncbi:hypothetical protein GCM10009609_33240 [Pseudonocardia aurantiaca]